MSVAAPSVPLTSAWDVSARILEVGPQARLDLFSCRAGVSYLAVSPPFEFTKNRRCLFIGQRKGRMSTVHQPKRKIV